MLRVRRIHGRFGMPPFAVSRVRATAFALSAIALTLLASACEGNKSSSAASGTGGTIIIVSTSEPETLFPPRASNAQDLEVVGSVFDRLAEIGPELHTTGDVGFTARLAKRWTWSNDSLSIAFDLDPAIRWHDGKPLRAEDVRFTFATYTSKAVASEASSLLGNIDSVSVRDSLTAVFWFKRRTPQQFMDATYSMYILPSHLLSSVPDTALVNAPFGRAPVGTGRFRFAKWDAKSRLEIVADTANARGRAVLDRVIWTFVSDPGAASLRVASGEADFLYKVRGVDVAQVASSSHARVERTASLTYAFVGFNLTARRAASTTARPHPVLGDVRVRQALAMAVDRATMVRTVLDSAGVVAFGPAPRVLIPDTSALVPLTYSVTAANALLASAGWIDSNGDGVRDRNGVRLAFELLVPSNGPTKPKFAVLLQAAFKAVGADVSVQNMDGSALGPRLEASDFDAWVGAYNTNPGLQGMRQTWMSRGASNAQHYASRAFDADVDSALTSFDATRSRALWTKAFQLAIDEAPSIWLYEEKIPVGVHRRIRMAPLRADAWFANLADWSVDQAQRIDRDNVGLRGAR